MANAAITTGGTVDDKGTDVPTVGATMVLVRL